MNWLIDELYRMFIGDSFAWHHLLEIMFRTAFMYMYTIGNVRLMDKRSMGMLNSFEIIIIVALGSAVGDPMFYKNVPLIPAMLTITTIVFIERVLAKISMRSLRFEQLLNGTPVMVIKDGQLINKALKAQNMSQEELYSILRLRGVRKTSEVEYAYLEPAGSISVIRKDGATSSELIPGNSQSR